jgi:hypothetical protein
MSDRELDLVSRVRDATLSSLRPTMPAFEHYLMFVGRRSFLVIAGSKRSSKPLTRRRSTRNMSAPQASTPLQRQAGRWLAPLGASPFLTGPNGDLVMENWFDHSLQVVAQLRNGCVGRALWDTPMWSKVLRVPMAWILLRALLVLLSIAGPSGSHYALNILESPSSGRRLFARTSHERAVRTTRAG